MKSDWLDENVNTDPVLLPGDRVLARWNDGEFWFSGQIVRANGQQMTILYDDGMEDIRPVDTVKPFDWQVGSRIDAIWSGNGGWYAARIMEMNEDGTMLTVRFDDDGIREGRASGFCRSR